MSGGRRREPWSGIWGPAKGAVDDLRWSNIDGGIDPGDPGVARVQGWREVMMKKDVRLIIVKDTDEYSTSSWGPTPQDPFAGSQVRADLGSCEGSS